MPHEEVVPGILDFVVEVEASPGIVVNEDLAARTPCTCYVIDAETRICYSKGIIGTLTKAQRKLYCTVEIPKTQGPTRRVKKFREASEVCQREIADIPKGERLRPRLECMGRELRKRGIEF